MKAAIKWLPLLVVFLSMMGCVSQRELDQARTLYRRSQEQIADLQTRLEEAQARIRALEAAQGQQDPQLLAKLEQLMAERDRLAKALAEAEERLRAAGAQDPRLPAELDRALMELAQAYPDFIEYDPARGMLRFRSDLTFALGSTEVSANAANSLRRLAGILNSPIAQPYEVNIVGHTDNVRIAKPQTRAAHPTNWHLSVHRSIAVKDVLQQAGVTPVRMSVAGHGEFRPVVPNGPRGSERNRRVEIFLRRNSYTGPGTEMAPTPVEAAPAAPAQPAAPAAPAQPDETEILK